MLLGALAQNIPDIDFLASFWLPATSDLLAHRGFTHSFLFLALTSPMLAWLSSRFFRGDGLGFKQWLWFWGLQIFIHIFIDSFNAYGTGWLEPFSHMRISFNTFFVIDPLFFIWPAIACIFLLLLRKGNKRRKLFPKIALILSSLYLLCGLLHKVKINDFAEAAFKQKNIAVTGYFTTPTPANIMLWMITGKTDSGYYIGYKSLMNHTDSIQFHFVYRNDSLLGKVNNERDVTNLLRFSGGYYTLGMRQDSVVFNVIRFGEMNGWSDPNPGFIFYYYLQYPDNNKLIVQRGRFAKWNKATLTSFWEHIKGD